MTSTKQSSMRVVAPEINPPLSEAKDEEITEKTAAELRKLCKEKGEEFDTALTEAQARERIARLKEMD
ncbi:hypothetical protein [uncultured Tateyamaria sp.]|uniref:hypothetical protein n=1 Tax=uncultured Tateyamaria sp. TaxID=455651 RepID=UPI002633F793|nr:hypothetical protein [uncultured Tateyamaria sp.]